MVHDANANLVNELRVPSDADDTDMQETLMRLFSAQVRDLSKSDAVEGQDIRAKRSVLVSDQALEAQSSISYQALKASDSVQISQSQSSRVQVQFSLSPMHQYQATVIRTVIVH